MRPDSDEFVLELLVQCKLKLQVLQMELKGKDLDTVMKEMEEDEVRTCCIRTALTMMVLNSRQLICRCGCRQQIFIRIVWVNHQ